jgi:hypothetical protein
MESQTFPCVLYIFTQTSFLKYVQNKLEKNIYFLHPINIRHPLTAILFVPSEKKTNN